MRSPEPRVVARSISAPPEAGNSQADFHRIGRKELRERHPNPQSWPPQGSIVGYEDACSPRVLAGLADQMTSVVATVPFAMKMAVSPLPNVPLGAPPAPSTSAKKKPPPEASLTNTNWFAPLLATAAW